MKLLSNVVFFALTLCATAQISFTESSVSQNINVSFGEVSNIGGLSFFDFDNDGWDDLTYASENGDPIYVFKNNNGVFTPVTLNFVDPQSDSRQINWVDIDNDGDNDLFIVSENASNKLYLNEGAMNLTDITAVSGISTANMHSWAASWGDYNNDGYLDLFLSNRDNFGNPNILYKNNGNNTFTNVTVAAGIANTNDLTFCASFFDFNNDGWQDIYIVNDRNISANVLYKNNGDETFTDVSESSGTGIVIDAMSSTIDDYNNDGWLDIYVTNTIEGNYFLKNNGNETFTNIAGSNGTGFYSWAWGAVFLDADNDKDLDLYVSGKFDGTGGYLPSAFYENSGTGNFTIPTNAGFANDTAESYSNAIGDINNDGFPDITVLNKSPINNFLWLNNGNSNNWLKVTLEGTTSNSMGIGSWIEISLGGDKQYRYTLNGEGYASQNSGTEFFGLGNNTIVDYVKVKWLSGVEDILYNVSANQKLHIVESTTLSDSENKLGDITLFPNPTKGKVTLKTDLSNYQIALFNVLGTKIYSALKLSNTTELDFSLLRSGVYMLRITTANKTTLKKIIVE